MICPHCKRDGKGLVMETRQTPTTVYRRRSCGHCGKTFVSTEVAEPGTKMPAVLASRHRVLRKDGLFNKTAVPRGTGAHLQEFL